MLFGIYSQCWFQQEQNIWKCRSIWGLAHLFSEGGSSQRGCLQVILYVLGVTGLSDVLGLYGSAETLLKWGALGSQLTGFVLLCLASEKTQLVLLKHPLQLLTAEMWRWASCRSSSVVKVEISGTWDVMMGNYYKVGWWHCGSQQDLEAYCTGAHFHGWGMWAVEMLDVA